MQLLLATHNRGKRREWLPLLAGLDIELLLPDDLGLTDEIAETGTTYRENALIKARALAALSGLPALADDSGLEVDALEGAPGVYSARYHLGDDAVRYRALLKALADVPEGARGARFRCLAALVLPDGREFLTEGVCEGVIAFEPCGEAGFGYDPVFYMPERGVTMAQLSAEEKNRISHRARAAQQMCEVLVRELGVRREEGRE
ncbi:MAG TPA: RdgB/HAM1 family non-canonical purine NTP pyrophosphatase [Anaerolineae bacterium]|nr:RdgB/HAM1 family non-canonical purine NTP pyrophosphatase [Anaerolineae bacterium]